MTGSISLHDHEDGLAVSIDLGRTVHLDLSHAALHHEVVRNGGRVLVHSAPDGAETILAIGGLLGDHDMSAGSTDLGQGSASKASGVILLGVNSLVLGVHGQQGSLVGAENIVGGIQLTQEGIVGDGVLSLSSVDGIAILIQEHIVLALNVQSILVGVVVAVLILLITDGDLLAGDDLVQSAVDGLSLLNGLDVALSIGVQNDVVRLEAGGLELVARRNGTSDRRQGDISVLGLGSSDGLVDLGNIGVDADDGDLVGIAIQEDLGQSAVANIAIAGGIEADVTQLQVVALLDIGKGIALDAVNINNSLLVLIGHLQVSVDGAQLDVLGVGHVSGLGIGADLHALVGPLGSGTAEVISNVALLDQLVEVLLSELDIAVAALAVDVAIVDRRAAPALGLSGRVVGHGDVADGDGGVLLVLDHVSLQHVEGIQASLFTGDSLDTVEVADQTISQASVQSALADRDGPVSAGVALAGSVIAQSAQQHLHEGIAGQSVGGLEGAVSITGDDAFLLAVSNVASEGVVGRNVPVGSSISHQGGCGGGAKDQVADDLGSSATGQGGGGIEGTIGVTIDDLHGGHHVDSFSVLNLGAVGEVLGTGRDGDQRHGHHQSQYQRKELLHGVSSF